MKNHLKKIIAILIAISILASTNTPQVFATSAQDTATSLRMQPVVEKYNGLTTADLDAELEKYADAKAHWGKEYVPKISALGIVSGYPDGNFGPNDTLLGGQFVLMLVKTIGYTPEVPTGTPYYMPFVEIALEEGILKEGEIKDYTKPISRELAASLTRRVVGKYEEIPNDYYVPGDDPEATGEKGLFDNVYVGYQKTKMSDYEKIDSQYLQDVIDCYRMGLITGSNNKFNPKGSLTRAEGSVIIVKLIDKKMRVESVPQANEQFKWTNKLSAYPGNRAEAHGMRENKEYTVYKGRFPMLEMWDVAYAMNKQLDKINDGAYEQIYNEKTHQFVTSWFPTAEIEEKSRMDNPHGLIISQNKVYINSEITQLKKEEQYNIYDNVDGNLYSVYSWDVDNYNKSFKNYVDELLKVWFGAEYDTAKKLHDQYLNYALKGEKGGWEFRMINGRQVEFSGGVDLGGRGFSIRIWAQGAITEETMYKKK